MKELNNDEAAMFKDIDKFNKRLSMSNALEISAAIFVIVVFLFYAFIFESEPVLLPLGSVLIAGGSLFIIIYILRNGMRKGKSPSEDDKLDYFKYWIHWYENTYKLVRSIFWWYLLPLIPGFIAFTIGMAQSIHGKFLQTSLKLGFLALITGGFVYWLNRYYASKKLQRRIDKLNELISVLESK